mmetsp:Transcript_16458/g.42184  ORF Transcript_16458/g.42184 Transcript_16458/m.42184 type:complete len:231 (-) Transcript_16458:640-1332(-)
MEEMSSSTLRLCCRPSRLSGTRSAASAASERLDRADGLSRTCLRKLSSPSMLSPRFCSLKREPPMKDCSNSSTAIEPSSEGLRRAPPPATWRRGGVAPSATFAAARWRRPPACAPAPGPSSMRAGIRPLLAQDESQPSSSAPMVSPRMLPISTSSSVSSTLKPLPCERPAREVKVLLVRGSSSRSRTMLSSRSKDGYLHKLAPSSATAAGRIGASGACCALAASRSMWMG